MQALRLPGQVTRGARGTGRTVTRPQGQCSASSLQALQVLHPPERRGPSPLPMPRLTLVKMGPEGTFSRHARAGFLYSGDLTN